VTVLSSGLGVFYLDKNPIKSHVLGLLLIDGLRRVALDNEEVEAIINDHLRKPMSKQRMINCQNALIDAGYEEYAQL
jgi:hypothetical protein